MDFYRLWRGLIYRFNIPRPQYQGECNEHQSHPDSRFHEMPDFLEMFHCSPSVMSSLNNAY